MSGRWIERLTADGSSTLAHGVHGETFHSLSGAWTQARRRYAAECRVRDRALELGAAGARALRLLDVGTGLGLNLAAALEAVAGTDVAIEATSLEIDAEVVEHAVSAPREPADLERWHAPVRAALAAALRGPPGARVPFAGGGLRLHLGDARSSLAALPDDARFDAVFLDPFSPRVEPDLWSPEVLLRIARHMAPGSRLSTYSAATAVRAGLAAAGLRVGPGVRVGQKREGTVASPDLDLPSFEPRVQRRIEARARRVAAEPRFPPPAGDPRGSMP